MSEREPAITINGVSLSVGQSMAVRVAVSAFHADMCGDTPLGDDGHGRAMQRHYRERLDEVIEIMIRDSQ